MNIAAIGRCIDQPILINSIQSKMPNILVGTGLCYGAYDTINTFKKKTKESKKNAILKNSIIISSTIAASLAGAYGVKIAGKQIIPRLLPFPSKNQILSNNKKSVVDFLSKVNVSEKIKNILNKSTFSALSCKDVDVLLKEIPYSKDKDILLSTLLPKAENLDAKGIFSEIGRLSLLGAIPVVGGIAGGIVADKVTHTSSPKSTANKIKEGFYQYFANIFLCNVGAALALLSAEGLQKAGIIKPLSSLNKMFVILLGITSMGILGGSYIANKLSQKFIDPIFNKDKNKLNKSVYDERRPEVVDIALHADDIATAGVLSGFKWIEPALPLMYFVSGYRAGIGYRNNKKH